MLSVKYYLAVRCTGMGRCVKLGQRFFLKFYEVKDDCLIRVYLSYFINDSFTKFNCEDIFILKNGGPWPPGPSREHTHGCKIALNSAQACSSVLRPVQ